MRLMNKADRAAYRAAMIPSGAERDPRSGELGEAYTYEKSSSFAIGEPEKVSYYAIAFWGSSGKPLFHYRYRTEPERAERLRMFFKGLAEKAAYKAKLKAERDAAPRGLEVGDILVSSWGYDQTNIDYYEVTRLVGEKQVEIRMIGAMSEAEGMDRGRSVPRPGHFIGEPMIKLAKNGSVSVRGFTSASKMEPVAVVAGKKMYRSHYWSSYA